MISLPLHYYSIRRDSHLSSQNLPAQFYLYYLTAHVLTLPIRFSRTKVYMRSVEAVNGYQILRNCARLSKKQCGEMLELYEIKIG